ncbi:hypothetical protein [Marinobacterium aestuariivivens]|uniref:Uncharacterized protein n=1 Tax=Marinobacterium aestuariivivens TaxID=1698799 RepID=A0ABW2A5Y7_9GAMM
MPLQIALRRKTRAILFFIFIVDPNDVFQLLEDPLASVQGAYAIINIELFGFTMLKLSKLDIVRSAFSEVLPSSSTYNYRQWRKGCSAILKLSFIVGASLCFLNVYAPTWKALSRRETAE